MRIFLFCINLLLLLVASSGQAAEIRGLWKVSVDGSPESDWIVGVNNGTVFGSSYWYGQTGYTDKLSGTVNGNQISITRDLPAPYLGKTQSYTGTISDTNVFGVCSGTGLVSSCVWTATITPIGSGSSPCPTCPTTPACPNPPAECPVNYNMSTGRLTVPCVSVPMAQPFGLTETLKYSIEMQQRNGKDYIFDLDLNKVKQIQ